MGPIQGRNASGLSNIRQLKCIHVLCTGNFFLYLDISYRKSNVSWRDNFVT